MGTVKIDGAGLTLENVLEVARGGAIVIADKTILEKSARSRKTVERLIDSDQPMYGINTGFGALSDQRIPRQELEELQVNLLRSHATSVGRPLPRDIVRAMILLRTNSLLKGYSAVRPETIKRLIDLLNMKIHPVIPETGSVGASGDLSPLSHMSLVLIGEGEAEYQGRIMPGAKALETAGLSPLKLGAKEGLALNNGTQQMTAMGCLLLDDALDLLLTMQVALALSLEGLNGWIDAFDEAVQRVRPYKGQAEIASNIRALLSGSTMIRSVRKGFSAHERPQDPYSFRCAPQVMGAALEGFNFTERILEIEVNSATDNPLVFADDETVISGGNFHGQPIALALDTLSIGLAILGGISERRVSALLDPSMNNGLSPFLVGKSTRPGLSSGLMAVQYTAASLVAENKVLTHPASSDSIPTSANFEDFVSMGPGAALKASRILENCRYIAAIELLAGMQAVDLRSGGKGLSPADGRVFQVLRTNVPEIARDRPYHQDIDCIYRLVKSRTLTETVKPILHSSTGKRR